jgi:Zn-dependent protease
VALAGPISNLVVAMIFAIPIRLFSQLPYVADYLLTVFVWVNIVLAVFNMIPLPPLDGFSVLMGILASLRSKGSRQAIAFISRYEAQLPLVLFGIILIGAATRINLLGAVLGPPTRLLERLILG